MSDTRLKEVEVALRTLPRYELDYESSGYYGENMMRRRDEYGDWVKRDDLAELLKGLGVVLDEVV